MKRSDPTKTRYRVPGKLILFGEYALTYGVTGLAIPVPRYMYLRSNSQGNAFRALSWNGECEEIVFEGSVRDSFFCHLQEIFPNHEPALDFIDGFFPVLGLGTSSASFVLACCFRDQVDLRLCSESERRTFFQRNFALFKQAFPSASGIDFATHIFQSALIYQSGKTPQIQTLPNFQAPGVFVSTPWKEATATNLKKFHDMASKNQSSLEYLAQISEQAIACLQKNSSWDVAELKNLLEENVRILRELFPKHLLWNKIDALRKELLQTQKWVVIKPLGAFGGDCLWILAENNVRLGIPNAYYRFST